MANGFVTERISTMKMSDRPPQFRAIIAHTAVGFAHELPALWEFWTDLGRLRIGPRRKRFELYYRRTLTMTNQNPEAVDPEAWYATRKAEFAEALPSVGVTTDVAVKGLLALYDADLRSLVPDPGNQLSGELVAWFHKNRLDYVRRQVEALLGEDT